MPMFFVKCFSKVWMAFDHKKQYWYLDGIDDRTCFDHKKQYWYLDGIDDRTLLFRFWEVVG